jgi:predicted N-acetyltransferase YhbS
MTSELTNAIGVDVVDVPDLGEIAEFYKSVGYGGGVSDADVTLGVKLGGRWVGAVRLCTEGGVIVLRGMQVAPDFQRKGIGRALLDQCLPYLDQSAAYCVPYVHLTEFYGRVGFVITPPELLPAFLADRLAAYVSTNRQTLAMKRMPS